MSTHSTTSQRPPLRLLVLCTHNSARSQMAEGWLKHYAKAHGLEAEVWSAGTEKTFVKPDAITVMREVGLELNGHYSKTITELPDPWEFDLVLTVCDSAKEACPLYPAKTVRLHVGFPDPSGQGLDAWREVRDAIGRMSRALVQSLAQQGAADEAALRRAV
jgi:arsenate reductase